METRSPLANKRLVKDELKTLADSIGNVLAL